MAIAEIELNQGPDIDQYPEQRLFLSLASWIVLALLTLVPIVFATGFSQFEHIKTLVLVGGAAMALGFWGVHIFRGHALTLVAGRVSLLFFLFIGFAVLAVSWSPSPVWGLIEATRWLSLGALTLVILAPMGRPIRFLEFATAVSLGGAICAAFGFLDFAGISVFTTVWNPPGPAGAFDAVEFASIYYALALPLIIGALSVARGWLKIVLGVCFLFIILHFGLIAVWTTILIITISCLLAVSLILLFQKGPSLLALYPALILIVIMIVAATIGQVGFEKENPLNESTNLPRLTTREGFGHQHLIRAQIKNTVFATDRMEVLAQPGAYDYLLGLGFDLFRDEPIIGHGANSWWFLQTPPLRDNNTLYSDTFDIYPAYKSPHNGWMKIAVEYGVVGIILFLAWLMAVMWITFSALSAREERYTGLLEHWALTASVMVGIALLTISPLIELSAASLLFITCVAMLIRLSAALNNFQDWSREWIVAPGSLMPGGESSNGRQKRALLIGLGAVASSLLIIIPNVFYGVSNYYRGLADHLMQHTHYERAHEYYGHSFNWFPYQGEVLYNRGVAAMLLGTLKDSLAELNVAADLRPNDSRILHLAATAHLHNERYVEATELARQAVRAFPNNIEARKTLAAALQLRLNPNQAADILIETIALNPPRDIRATIHQRLAELYATVLEQPRQAIDHYDKAANMMAPGFTRTQLFDKKEELEKRLERERLMREGKPIPRHLLPKEELQHHDHDGHGH